MPFPNLRDGDVVIKFTASDDPWMLHSHALALHSSWFKASLSHRWDQGNAVIVGSRRGYELRFEKDRDEGTLMRDTSIGDDTEMVANIDFTGSSNTTGTLESRKRRGSSVRALRAMLGALYHVPPSFDDCWNEAALNFIEVLIATAEYYGCAALIRTHIHHHLRRHNKVVLRSCQDHWLKYLKLALLAQADWIVKECVIYLICRSGIGWEGLRKGRKDLGGAWQTICDKRKAFIQRLQDTKLKLLRVESSTKYNQAATDVFRAWVCDETRPEESEVDLDPRPKCGYGAFYRTLLEGEPPFELDASRLRDHGGMLNYAQISESDLKSFGSSWSAMFEEASSIVQPLLVDITMLKAKVDIDTNLRFMTVDDSELPWNRKS